MNKPEKFSKEWYVLNQGKKCKAGRYFCTVSRLETESRGGSWERGFRFYETEWAILVARLKNHELRYSMDHGKTWHHSERMAKTSKGKMKLSSDNHGEFAFNSIQKINRDYEGSGYRWKR